MSQTSNYPDNYIPGDKDIITDQEYNFACEMFQTDNPTDEQIQKAIGELTYQHEALRASQED
jgi:hypothetical protein